MPVSLEILNRPDATDLADLQKIYADYPLPPVQSLSAWLDAERESGKTLVAGRFNGALLAALWLGQDGAIEHLSVRAVTRRRGTARQLLQLLQSHARQLHVPRLQVIGHDELAGLWQSAGFSQRDGSWQWAH